MHVDTRWKQVRNKEAVSVQPCMHAHTSENDTETNLHLVAKR